jgi:hypothetical protein
MQVVYVTGGIPSLIDIEDIATNTICLASEIQALLVVRLGVNDSTLLSIDRIFQIIAEQLLLFVL